MSAVLVGAAVVYAAGHFSMTTDTAKLISPDLPWRQNEMAFDKAFPQQDDMIVAVIDVVLLTAVATLGAFLYNMSAALLGGIDVTLTEDR